VAYREAEARYYQSYEHERAGDLNEAREGYVFFKPLAGDAAGLRTMLGALGRELAAAGKLAGAVAVYLGALERHFDRAS
jgi:hypothetical protein